MQHRDAPQGSATTRCLDSGTRFAIASRAGGTEMPHSLMRSLTAAVVLTCAWIHPSHAQPRRLFDATAGYPNGPLSRFVAVSDLDGNGLPDLVTTDSYSNKVNVLLGIG